MCLWKVEHVKMHAIELFLIVLRDDTHFCSFFIYSKYMNSSTFNDLVSVRVYFQKVSRLIYLLVDMSIKLETERTQRLLMRL